MRPRRFVVNRAPNPQNLNLVEFIRLIKQTSVEHYNPEMQRFGNHSFECVLPRSCLWTAFPNTTQSQLYHDLPGMDNILHTVPSLTYVEAVQWIRENEPWVCNYFPDCDSDTLARQADEDIQNRAMMEMCDRQSNLRDEENTTFVLIRFISLLYHLASESQFVATVEDVNRVLDDILHDVSPETLNDIKLEMDNAIMGISQRNIGIFPEPDAYPMIYRYIRSNEDYNFVLLNSLFDTCPELQTRLCETNRVNPFENPQDVFRRRETQMPFSGADFFDHNFDTTGNYFNDARDRFETYEQKLKKTQEDTPEEFIKWLELYTEDVGTNQLDLSIVTTAEEITEMVKNHEPREDIDAYNEIFNKLIARKALENRNLIRHYLNDITKYLSAAGGDRRFTPYIRRMPREEQRKGIGIHGWFNREDVHKLRFHALRKMVLPMVGKNYPNFKLPPNY